ncbi:MAG: choice-of-anchor Q domain-containing protein, partial [Brevefilum sp.]|nr:choice-of-anchor Q domain-containing protein [Brevefilum sp.]
MNSPGATLTVVNSTLSGNTASQGGGGIYNGGTLTLTNSTLSGNSAYSSAMGHGLNNSSEGTLNYANTIIANSPESNGDCRNYGTMATNTNNLVEDGSCSAEAVNYVSGDPMLAALADNGGPTHTMALLPGSPAIDAGDDTICAAPPV